MNTDKKSSFGFLSRLSIAQKGMVLVMVPLFFEFCFIAALASLLISAEQDMQKLRKTRECVLAIHEIKNVMTQSISIIASGDNSGQNADVKEIIRLRDRLKKPLMTGITPEEFPELKDVMKAAELPKAGALSIMNEIVDKVCVPGMPEQVRRKRLVDYARKNKPAILQFAFEMGPLNNQLLEIEGQIAKEEPEEVRRFQSNLMMLVAGGVLLSAAVSVAVGVLITRNIFSRLEETAESAQLISRWQPLPAMQEGTDEIAQLDMVLHESSETLNYTRQKELTILDNAASLICSVDSRLKFLDASRRVEDMLQIAPDEIVGMSLLSLLRTDVVEQTRLKFEQLMMSGGTDEIETIMRRTDRSYIECKCTVSWSPEKKQFFCVIHDITQRKSIERLKRHLISIVSHDLRAPLTAVLINIGLMMEGKRGEVSESVSKELTKSEQSLNRLMALVNDLLELEKLGLGKETLEKDCISAAHVCRQAKEALESLASQSNIRIQNPIGDAAILGNENRLVQVMVNLLSNAIKFSPPIHG